MINFIIYEDNQEMQELYQRIIHSFFSGKKIKLNFFVFNQYQNGLEQKLLAIRGKKIFILDIEVSGKSGLDLARLIRSNGDWYSPLIVITSYEHLKNTGFTGKMLMLDFISKKENIPIRLQDSLEVAYDIVHKHDAYTFQYNGELFHVNYDDILYFEKDLNDNYTFLYTKTTSFKIKCSILQIEKELQNNTHFLKTHRSCIVNIHNIQQIDVRKNILYFGSKHVSLLTKESREILKKKLKTSQIIR